MVTMNANDWQHEMQHLLEMFERESTVSLRKINQCFVASGRPFDEKFRQYFLKVSTLRLDTSFNTVLFEGNDENVLQVSPNFSVPIHGDGNVCNANTSRSAETRGDSLNENVMGLKIENEVNAVVEIDDSADQSDGDGSGMQVATARNTDGSRMGANASPKSNNGMENRDSENNENLNNEDGGEVNKKDEPKIEDEIATVDLPLVEFDPNQDEDCSSVENDDNIAGSSGDQNQPISSSNVLEVMKRRSVERYKCKDCSYTAQYKCHINQHQRIHAQQKKMGIPLGPNDGQYKCPHCDQQFNKWNGLREHLTKSHKNRQRLFNCSRCMRRFARKNEKKRHEIRCQNCRYECYLCKKYTTRAVTNMQGHMRTHTGAKPFECAICKKSFRQKCTLERHLNAVH